MVQSEAGDEPFPMVVEELEEGCDLVPAVMRGICFGKMGEVGLGEQCPLFREAPANVWADAVAVSLFGESGEALDANDQFVIWRVFEHGACAKLPCCGNLFIKTWGEGGDGREPLAPPHEVFGLQRVVIDAVSVQGEDVRARVVDLQPQRQIVPSNGEFAASSCFAVETPIESQLLEEKWIST